MKWEHLRRRKGGGGFVIGGDLEAYFILKGTPFTDVAPGSVQYRKIEVSEFSKDVFSILPHIPKLK